MAGKDQRNAIFEGQSVKIHQIGVERQELVEFGIGKAVIGRWVATDEGIVTENDDGLALRRGLGEMGLD